MNSKARIFLVIKCLLRLLLRLKWRIYGYQQLEKLYSHQICNIIHRLHLTRNSRHSCVTLARECRLFFNFLIFYFDLNESWYIEWHFEGEISGSRFRRDEMLWTKYCMYHGDIFD